CSGGHKHLQCRKPQLFSPCEPLTQHAPKHTHTHTHTRTHTHTIRVLVSFRHLPGWDVDLGTAEVVLVVPFCLLWAGAPPCTSGRKWRLYTQHRFPNKMPEALHKHRACAVCNLILSH